MREQIYTIPVTEVYDLDCECPLCELEKRLEAEAIEYALGAAMMEPDYRIESNAKGYCNKHFRSMFAMSNKLSLALVLETHLAEIFKFLTELDKNSKNIDCGGLFKKGDCGDFCSGAAEKTDDKTSSCVVCDKISYTMGRYADVLIYLWAHEPEFKKKFEQSKGVCLPHFSMLAAQACKTLGKKEAAEFMRSLCKKEKEAFAALTADVHKFTLKFDYRNKDMEWGTAKDSPQRAIEKLSGYITDCEPKD